MVLFSAKAIIGTFINSGATAVMSDRHGRREQKKDTPSENIRVPNRQLSFMNHV